MSGAALVYLISLMAGAVIFLPAFVIYRKIRTAGAAKKLSEYRKKIIPGIEKLILRTGQEFKDDLDEFAKAAEKKGLDYINALDEFLLYTLETPGFGKKDYLVEIARRMDFPADCIEQINYKDPEISALGSRRAGLYMVIEAADDMMAALNIISSENQFEILMAFARFGRADLMQKAFEKIRNNVLLNDRAVTEILSAFPMGAEKKQLFRSMLADSSTSALFLNAIGKDIPLALAMVHEITAVLHDGNKESRVAAIRAFSAPDSGLPQDEIIVALEDNDWEVRAVAAKALRNNKKTVSSMALYRALFDQQWWVRQNAANALMTHPDFEILFILAAESGDEYARDSVIAALENGGNPVLLRSLKLMAV